MTRQVWLVFYGRRALADDVGAHGRHGRRDGAGAAATTRASRTSRRGPCTSRSSCSRCSSLVGGVIDLPFEQRQLNLLDRWLAPILRTAPEITPTSFGAAFLLSTIALAIAVVGIVVGVRGLPQRAATPTAPTRRSKRLGGVRARCSTTRYYLDIGLARFVSGPVTAFARFLSDGRRPRRDRRRGQRHRPRVPARGGGGLRRCRPGCVRNYALAHRARRGAAPALRRDAGDALMPCSPTSRRRVDVVEARLPAADLLDLPARGRRGRRDAHARPAPGARRAPSATSRAWPRSGWRCSCSRSSTPAAKPATSSSRDHSWIRALGIRWTLGVDGISLFMVALTRCCSRSPARVGQAREAEVVHVLDAAARVGDDRRVPRARRDRVLHLLRVRARADVLPHRGLGSRQPALRGDEVLPVHRGRLRVPVRRDPVGRVPAPARDARTSPSTCACSPTGRRRAHSRWHREVAVPRVRGRLRGEGPAVPVPHVAARRAHRRADRGFGRAGRRAC